VVTLAAFKNIYAEHSNDKYILSQLHPHRWSSTSLAEFGKIIDFLHSKGVQFILPYDYYLLESGAEPKDTKAPSIPANLKASNITINSIKLNWGASFDNVGVTGYEVQYNGVTKSVSGTSTTLTGLTPNVTYNIRVRAKDASGNQSLYSAYETAVTDAETSTTPVLLANAGLDKQLRCSDTYRTLGNAISKPTSDGATYLWTTSNGQIVGANNGKTVKGSKAGTYTLTVSKSGSASVNDSAVITQETGCTTEPESIPSYTVNYIATTGGTLTGTAAQTVKKGQQASTVTAVANNGYTFVGWSDGKATASRTDINITSNHTFRAIFSKNASEPDDTPDVVVIDDNEEPTDTTQTEDKTDESSAGSFPIGLLLLGFLALFRRK
jgi:uncharacterized repeat protein (TIGR02543 family)